jgi:uncharacterized membrane protein
MSILQVFFDWIIKLPWLDQLDLFIFLTGTAAYKIFLIHVLKDKQKKYYIQQLQSIRNEWIGKYGMGGDPILVVQTLRNKIMISSFMASTALILVIGGFNFIFGMDFEKIKPRRIFLLSLQDPDLEVVKVLLIILVLLYSFFHFLWHTRELHNMSLILNIPESRFREITPLQPLEYLTNMYINSGIHFTLGIRGYYFLIPLLLWVFHPVIMIFSFFGIMLFLVRRDLGLAPYQK